LTIKRQKRARKFHDSNNHSSVFPCFLALLSRSEGGHFAITQLSLAAIKQKMDDTGVEVFKSLKEEKEHGVTPLHILSELQCTAFREGRPLHSDPVPIT
jgi:hypothetical protein